MLLLASCGFYMYFKPEYIVILAFTIVIDYWAGILIAEAPSQQLKQRYLLLSLISNIGILAFFKYYNFLDDNITGLAKVFGVGLNIPYLHWLLPIGLSFHTFQAMSYTIEVSRGNQEAERHFGIYSLYVMFYPQLVAGPIERPQNMLHQFHEEHHFSWDNLIGGLKLMGWGVFKKVVIADRMATIVDYVYADPYKWHGFALVVTLVVYAAQIYCDFSGYSDIALGSAQVMGFKLMRNFNYPFRARNIADFWRRWHISLNTWFNDYLFTPLIVNKRDWGKWGVVFAIFVTFGISGLWHGASWTFVTWGLLNGAGLAYDFLSKKFRRELSKKIPAVIYNNVSVALTFSFCCLVWIFFRASTFKTAFYVLGNLFRHGPGSGYFSLTEPSLHGQPSAYLGQPLWRLAASLALIPLLFFAEQAISYKDENHFRKLPKAVRWGVYYMMAMAVLFFGVYNTNQFIYFQF